MFNWKLNSFRKQGFLGNNKFLNKYVHNFVNELRTKKDSRTSRNNKFCDSLSQNLALSILRNALYGKFCETSFPKKTTLGILAKNRDNFSNS